MTADVLVLRATREQSLSERIREKAERDLARIVKTTADIRRMTKLYQDRLDGRRDR